MHSNDPAAVFAALHESGGFVLPNAWDAGSAVLLAAAGFPAIATTSAGIAFSLGKPDYRVGDRALAVSREETLGRAAQIAQAVPVPVNVDLEAGYGAAPAEVAETVRLALAAGLAGGNIEDADPAGGLFDETLAAERIAAARETIDQAGGRFVLNARTDALQSAGGAQVGEAVRRANLYRAAGADCLFVPGTTDLEVVRILAREIDGPLNVVMGLGEADGSAFELIAAGARRVSIGGSLARAAYGLVRRAAAELKAAGTIGYAAGQAPQGELNALFAAARQATRQVG